MEVFITLRENKCRKLTRTLEELTITHSIRKNVVNTTVVVKSTGGQVTAQSILDKMISKEQC